MLGIDTPFRRSRGRLDPIDWSKRNDSTLSIWTCSNAGPRGARNTRLLRLWPRMPIQTTLPALTLQVLWLEAV